MIGYGVFTDEGMHIGKLGDILWLPANDAYVINDGNREFSKVVEIATKMSHINFKFVTSHNFKKEEHPKNVSYEKAINSILLASSLQGKFENGTLIIGENILDKIERLTGYKIGDRNNPYRETSEKIGNKKRSKTTSFKNPDEKEVEKICVNVQVNVKEEEEAKVVNVENVSFVNKKVVLLGIVDFIIL